MNEVKKLATAQGGTFVDGIRFTFEGGQIRSLLSLLSYFGKGEMRQRSLGIRVPPTNLRPELRRSGAGVCTQARGQPRATRDRRGRARFEAERGGRDSAVSRIQDGGVDNHERASTGTGETARGRRPAPRNAQLRARSWEPLRRPVRAQPWPRPPSRAAPSSAPARRSGSSPPAEPRSARRAPRAARRTATPRR